jgi:hypothetical protein
MTDWQGHAGILLNTLADSQSGKRPVQEMQPEDLQFLMNILASRTLTLSS